MINLKYYIIHHLPAIERRLHMEKFVDLFALKNIEWITDYGPDSIEVEILEESKIECHHSANGKYLNFSEISCYLKHKKVLRNLTKSNFDYGIVIEDDVEIPNFDFNSTVQKFITEMEKNNAEFLSVGSFGKFDLEKTEFPYIKKDNTNSTRCLHCYIIKKTIAEKCLDYLEDIKAPVDWQFNYAIRDLNIKNYWSYPHIYQKTERGSMKSLIR